jgi:Flp pilus assembly protein TadG
MLIVALALPALIGGAGFAVDTAQWYMWKRELQHSVDQAAISGAWALLNGQEGEAYKTWAQREFDTNQDKTSTFDSALSLQLADYAGGDDNSVIATASASKRLAFSGILLGRAATVQVRAQASFAPGGSADACLVSLATTGVGTQIGNNATVKAQCGLAALSCETEATGDTDGNGSYALEIDDHAHVETGAIYACGDVNVPDSLDGVAQGGMHNLTDAFADLDPPDNPTPQDYKCENLGGGNKQASLQPGTYSGLSVQCTTTFSPGIYVIDGGVLDLAGNYDVTGNGVMFVLKGGATIKFTGNGGNGSDTAPSNTINLTPMTASQVASAGYPDMADRYAGMLIFETRDNNPGSPGHKFAGNANSVIEGIIYLPSGDVTVIGTANVRSECLQISAHRINIAGGADLETFCPTDESIHLGTSGNTVKLVA